MNKIKRHLNFIVFIVYNHYKNGPNPRIAYFSTKMLFTLLLWFHILIIQLLFFYSSTHKYIKYIRNLNPLYLRLVVLLEIAVAYFIVVLFLEEEPLLNFKYDDITLKRGKRLFVIYLISFGVLFLLTITLQWHINW